MSQVNDLDGVLCTAKLKECEAISGDVIGAAKASS